MTPDIDEPVEVVAYDPRWPLWYEEFAQEVANGLGQRLRGVAHFGSTSVPGLAAKPIIDVLVAPVAWPLTSMDRALFIGLGYEHLGEAGVPGREYFRRRRERAANLAVVEFDGPLWRDNLLLRDYLRAHPLVAAAYGRKKKEVWDNGARWLQSYSAEKGPQVAALVQAANSWRAGSNA